MNARILEREVKQDGYKHVDISVNGTTFHAGIANPNGRYSERIAAAAFIVKACNEHEAQAAEIQRLRGLLEEVYHDLKQRAMPNADDEWFEKARAELEKVKS